MDVPVNADVNCVDGAAGRSSRVVLNPLNNEVTGVVIEVSGFPRLEYVVPVDLIRESTPQRIELRCTRAELAELPLFTQLEYQSGADARNNYEPGQWLFAPGANPVPSAVPLEHRNIAPHELALQRGAQVQATDGPVGTVADLIVDPVKAQLTHLVVRVGGLFNPRQVTITASTVDRIMDDTVYLNLDKKALEQLPDLPAAT